MARRYKFTQVCLLQKLLKCC